MTSPAITIIANIRGRGRDRRFKLTLRALRLAGAHLHVLRVLEPGDAGRHAAEIAQAHARGEGPDRLVIAGGDGTMNDVANGLAGSTVPVAFLPLGTANVLAHELALPADPAGLAEMILKESPRPVRLGRVNGRLFLLMAGVGIDAEVCAGVNRRAKALIRRGAYAVGTVGHWLRYRPRRFQVTVDDTLYSAASVVITNARHYAGPFVIAPAADLSDETLQVCLFLTPGRFAVIRYVLGMLTGRLTGMRDYRIVSGRNIRIEPEPGILGGDPVQVDGDALTVLPARIEAAAARLNLIRPGTGA